MRIYLDNCCFNRPFDDQSQLRILLETEAKLNIQQNIILKKFQLVWSYILDAENKANPFKQRKNAISDWKQQALLTVNENPIIIETAKKLVGIGLRPKDALHIACAQFAECSYFLTTDDKIINKNSQIEQITIIDPISFIKTLSQ